MLIGNGDGVTTDRGKLRVTLHHNEFDSVVQRAPRVRFGQVHLYNNRYVIPEDGDYRYSLGISTESRIVAENNSFESPGHVEVADLLKSWNGSALTQRGTAVQRLPRRPGPHLQRLQLRQRDRSRHRHRLDTRPARSRSTAPNDAAADVAREAGAGRAAR